MNPANFVPLRARLAQGDIVRTPTAGFVRAHHLADRGLLDRTEPVDPGDKVGLAMRVPRLVIGGAALVLRARYTLAVVVSPDCAIDKENTPMVLVAPIFPPGATSPAEWDGIRAGTNLGAFDLPGEPALELPGEPPTELEESFVDLSWTTAVHKEIVQPERIVGLSLHHVDRLQAAWLRFIALRELSTVGTVAAAVNKTIAGVETIQSSGRRHTVVLTLHDGSTLVLYQEPRRKGDWVEPVHIHRARFDREFIDARTESRLVLRVENDDPRTWKIACAEVGLVARDLPGGSTTHVEVACPDSPADLRVQLLGADAVLVLRVRAAP